MTVTKDSKSPLNVVNRFCDFKPNNIKRNQLYRRLIDRNKSSYSISSTFYWNNTERNDTIHGPAILMSGEWRILCWGRHKLSEQLEVMKCFPTWRRTRGEGEWCQSRGRIHTDKKIRAMTIVFKSEESCKRVFENPVFVVPRGRAAKSRQKSQRGRICLSINKNFLTTRCAVLARNCPGRSLKASYDPVGDKSFCPGSQTTEGHPIPKISSPQIP